MTDHLTVDLREADDARILALRGELDLGSVPLLTAEADAALLDGPALVLDLRELRFIDSTGLGALAGIDRAARAAGTTLTLVRGPRNVQRVFEVTGTVGAFAWADEPPD